MDSIDDSYTSLLDWSQFLDFNLNDHSPIIIPFLVNSTSNDNNNNVRVRKRDPRMVCPNFLAGMVPCACPELYAQLAAEEEEEAGGPGKKKARAVTRIKSTGFRCQATSGLVTVEDGWRQRMVRVFYL